MTTLNITVYTELKDDLLANAVRNAKTPKNVNISFSADGNMTDFPRVQALRERRRQDIRGHDTGDT